MGIKEVLAAPRSPWQRAYVERVIGTLRRDCLDHMIIFKRGLKPARRLPQCGPLRVLRDPRW